MPGIMPSLLEQNIIGLRSDLTRADIRKVRRANLSIHSYFPLHRDITSSLKPEGFPILQPPEQHRQTKLVPAPGYGGIQGRVCDAAKGSRL